MWQRGERLLYCRKNRKRGLFQEPELVVLGDVVGDQAVVFRRSGTEYKRKVVVQVTVLRKPDSSLG